MSASSEPMGFAGLASLATDLPKAVPVVERTVERPSSPPERDGPAATVRADKKPFWNFWTIFFTGAIGLALFGAVSGNDKGTGNRASAPSYQPTQTYQPPQSYSYQTPSPSPAAIEEEMPAQASGLIWNRKQIAYCLAERIRLEAMQAGETSMTNKVVAKFNAFVDDYNLRCGNYKYRPSDMQEARAWVEGRRSRLETEARATIASWR